MSIPLLPKPARRSVSIAAALLGTTLLQGQTLIINEVSNGPSGTKEFIEMLVIPTTPPEPCTPPPCLDIRGWIIDDNNGYHAMGSGVGIAAGALRFSTGAAIWSCVPVGTLIVIYNGGDPNPSLPAEDLSLTDGNCTIVASVASGLFEATSATPQPVPCSDPGGWGPAGAWNCVGMRNDGDCARITDGAGCEIFSVSYGDNTLNPLIFFPGAGTGDEWYFNDGDPYSQANWVQSCTSGCETPGAPNSPANAAYIAILNNGCTPVIDLPLQVDVSSTATCGCDGTATVTPSGSVAPYTYVWFDVSWAPIGQTSATATGLCTGTYHVQVTSDAGCIDTADVGVPLLPGPDPGSDGTAALCTGDAAIDLFAQLGGTPDAGGTWSPVLASGAGVFDPAADPPGIYTYSIASGGCPPATAEVTVSVTAPPNVTIAVDSISCNGLSDGVLEALADGAGPYTFTWNNSLPDGPVQGGLGPGTYTVSVTTTEGCASTASATLVDPAALQLAMSATDAYCGGTNGSACVAATGGTGGLQYLWDAGDGTAPCLEPTPAGLHTVQVTDLHGCSSTGSIVVEDDVPVIIAVPDGVSCFGAADGSITLTLPPGTIDVFGWSGPGGFTSTAVDISGLVPGEYDYTWTDVDGCTLTGLVSVGEPAALQLIATATAESCAGACDGALDAALLNGIGAPAFSLEPPEWSGAHFNGLCGGSYVVHAMDANGCAAEIPIDVPAGPEGADPTIQPVDPLCVYAGSILLQSADTGGTWYGPGIVFADSALFDPALAGAGDAIIIHDIEGSCNGPDTLVITVVPPPSSLFTTSLHGPVGADMVLLATNHTQGPASYQWTLDGVGMGGTTDLEQYLDAADASMHELCLVATDLAGCRDTSCQEVTAVNTTDIFVPNTFTPDGDGFNESFGVVVRGLEPMDGKLQIFDRWGELVYEGDGLSRARWDGTFKGRSLGPEVFIWRVAYRDPASHRDVAHIGHVTLLR